MNGMSPKTTGREEDYRDYEERDINDGWPYADAAPASGSKVANASYGQPRENFDEAGNPGIQRSNDTVIQSSNGVDLFGDDTEADVQDDAQEEAIANALSDAGIDSSCMELKVRRGIALLTGGVDTAEDRIRIEQLVSAIAGITGVRNELDLRGADGHIPNDWDD